MWFICLMYSLIEANKELQKYNKRSEWYVFINE
jgi:hypothetical protein